MAKKTEIIDQTTKEEIKEELLNEVKTKYKDEIVSDIVKDIKDQFNKEYKDTIKNDLVNEVKLNVKEIAKKDLGKMNRRKSFKILRLNIIIILLLGVIGFIGYRLYKVDAFGIIFGNDVVDRINNVTKTITEEKRVEEVKDFKWYKENYSYLLDNVKVTNLEYLKGNYKASAISNNDKLAMSYKLLNKEDIKTEGIINTIDNSLIEDAYKKIFSDEYKPGNFNIDGVNFAYSSSTNSYISVGNIKNSIELINEIVDIKESNGNILITTVVAVIKDNKVYNVNNLNTEVSVINGSLDISTISNKLSKVTYTFNNGLLDNISKSN